MSLINVLKCSDVQQFTKLLDAIETTLSSLIRLEKPLIDKISKFFDSNITYIVSNDTVASRFYSITAKVILNFAYYPLVCKVQNNAFSILKENESGNTQSLADGINLMEIPLASLNLPAEKLYELIPKLTYIDLSNFDFSKYDLDKFKFKYAYAGPCFRLKTSDKGTLFNVVKLCAVQEASQTAKCIRFFGIEDKSHLFKIAKLCADRSGGATALYINNFQIENKTHLYEIAMLCAQRDNNWATTENIKNFGIEDKTHLYEIAKISAKQYYSRTAERIKIYGIEDKTHLYEIAKLCAKNNGGETAKHILNFEFEDQTQLFEIAKLCVMQDPYHTVREIKNFGIEDPTQLFEFAKICAQNVCADTLQYIIINCGIKDKAQLFEIVKLAAQRDGRETSKNIKFLGIEDKIQLFEIAMLCAQKEAVSTAYNINNFGIEDPIHLFEITKLCAKKAGYEIAANIKDIKINDKTHLYEIAKICAGHHDYRNPGIPAFMKDFGIEDKRKLIEIAKICAKRCGGATAHCIKDFGIEDKIELIEIAKICAQQNGQETSAHIKNFGIEDHTQLFEIAKLCALNDGEGTTSNIKKFGIEDKTQLYEIAKLCTQHVRIRTAILIRKFRIVDQTQIIEIAKLCAQKNGGDTALYIENFGIEDKIQLFEIAKLCARQDGSGTASYIKNFGIDDKTQLFEIAKLCAEQSGDGTAAHIKSFGIENKSELFEIAKLCAQQAGGMASSITNFEIEDKAQLFEIATLCAQQDGGRTARYIKNFKIDDKTQLLEIAYLCAQQDGRWTAEYNQYFGIEDKAQLFEIAKLCAQQDGHGTAQYIYSFPIKDKKQLFEIATLCARKSGYGTAQHLKNFGIDDPNMRWELFLECLNTDQTMFNSMRSFCPLPEVVGEHLFLLAELLIKIIYPSNEEKPNPEEFFIGTKCLIGSLSCSKENKEILEQIADEIARLEIHIQNEAVPWLLKALFLCIQMPTENLNWLLESRLLLRLFNLHEPRLRSLLTAGLFKLAKSKSAVPKGTHGLPLLAIPFFQLQQLGVPPEKLKQISENLKRQQNKGKTTLKNAVTVQTILHTIHLLTTSSTLSSAQKIRAIDKIFYNEKQTIEENTDTILKRIAAVKVLLQMKNKVWPNSLKDPIDEFSASFEKLVPLKDVKGNVSERYEEIFGKCRNPYGLITYAAGLKTLNDNEALECLGRFVSAVFNGTFKETRYDTANNLHLKTISESHLEILNLWKQNSEKLLEITQEEENNKEFNSKEWIRTKLINDRHLGETKIRFIEDYFKAATDEDRLFVSKKLTEELQKAPSEILKLQQACIVFAEAKPDNFTPLLKEIQSCLDQRTEFAHDVNGMLQGKKKTSDLIIVNTDDPIDLLLCGSDVSGSCQRLDGDPKLNKGLLGYLMDGKNRLLAIKDVKGKIVARCLLRLMWDGVGPVIYRDRIYPEISDSRLMKALNQTAIELAKELKLPLTGPDEGIPYEKPLHALGGPAPYEYCDACFGIQKGPYTITKANTICCMELSNRAL